MGSYDKHHRERHGIADWSQRRDVGCSPAHSQHDGEPGLDERVRIVLDVEDYRLRKEESLKSLAVSLSERVKRTRRSVVMRPMGPHERRVVHTALQGDPEIVTYSQGEEPHRKVVISPKK